MYNNIGKIIFVLFFFIIFLLSLDSIQYFKLDKIFGINNSSTLDNLLNNIYQKYKLNGQTESSLNSSNFKMMNSMIKSENNY